MCNLALLTRRLSSSAGSGSHGLSRAATHRPTSNPAPVVARPPSEPSRQHPALPNSGRRPSSNSRPLPPLTHPSTPGGHPVNNNDNIKVPWRCAAAVVPLLCLHATLVLVLDCLSLSPEFQDACSRLFCITPVSREGLHATLVLGIDCHSIST